MQITWQYEQKYFQKLQLPESANSLGHMTFAAQVLQFTLFLLKTTGVCNSHVISLFLSRSQRRRVKPPSQTRPRQDSSHQQVGMYTCCHSELLFPYSYHTVTTSSDHHSIADEAWCWLKPIHNLAVSKRAQNTAMHLMVSMRTLVTDAVGPCQGKAYHIELTTASLTYLYLKISKTWQLRTNSYEAAVARN